MIIAKLKGGMGNQMFQYAIGRSISLSLNTSLYLDLSFLLDRSPKPKRYNFTFRNYDLDVFNIKSNIASPKMIPFVYKTRKGKIGMYIDLFIKKIIKNEGLEKSFNFDESIFLLKDNIYLDGYWQSPKYFSNIEDVIRKDFTLKTPLSIDIDNLIKVVEKENSLCVHVRRGDYIGNKNHEIVGKDYYLKAIEIIKSKTKIDKIYVFSDDIKWCEENMKFEFPTMFVGEKYSGEKAEGHLSIMRQCKYFIIPNSSFSWWGAWLSDYDKKIVIVPSQWFGDKTINSDDLIPKGWIRI